ncbi:MAG: sulfotransferase [Acidimicrobiales bacterium]
MRPQVLYVGGTGRSGSTVLVSLLGHYEGFLPVGELRYLWDRGIRQNQLCGCRLPFRSCPFWVAVITDAFGGFDAVDRLDTSAWADSLDRVRFIPLLAVSRLRSSRFQAALDDYGDAITRLVRSILSVSGARVVIDSSKDPSWAFLLDALGAFDLSVLHLVRDSRAVAYSWTRSRVRPEVHWTVEYMKRRSPLRTAFTWDANHVLFEALGRRSQRRYLRLRYEDFVRRPDDTIAAVVALPDPLVPENRSDDGWNHSISGNPVRFDPRPLQITLDDEWETNLAPEDRRLVTMVTAPLLKRYGYLGSR